MGGQEREQARGQRREGFEATPTTLEKWRPDERHRGVGRGM